MTSDMLQTAVLLAIVIVVAILLGQVLKAGAQKVVQPATRIEVTL